MKTSESNLLSSIASPKLALALKKANSNLSTLQARVDQISHEIRALEAYLKSKPTPSVIFPIYRTMENFTITEDIEHGACYQGTALDEFLTWEEGENGFRLFYKAHRVRDAFRDHKKLAPIDGNEEKQIEEILRRPLIETKLDIRLRSFKKLHEFVEAINLKIVALCEDENDPLGLNDWFATRTSEKPKPPNL